MPPRGKDARGCGVTRTEVLATVRLSSGRAGTDRIGVCIALLVLCAVIARIVFLAAAPIEAVAYRTTDDSYYYFKVAQHIVAGDGPTFDGINRTNGFHPLWMCVILPVFAATQHDPDLSVRLVCSLLAVLAGGSFLLCWSYVRRCAGPFAAAVAVIVLLHPALLNHMLNGLETGLLVFLLFLTLWLEDRCRLLRRDAAPFRKAGAGLLLALVFMCRLDTAFIPISLAILAWVFCTEKPWSLGAPRQLVSSYWPTLLVFVVLVSPYFFWNILSFGHGTPISGALKSSFPQPSLQISRLIRAQWLPYTAFLLVSTVWVLLSAARRGGYLRSVAFHHWSEERSAPFLAVLWLASVLHFAYAALFLKWAAYWWHFASHVPMIAMLLSLGCWTIVAGVRHRSLATGALLTLCVLAIIGTTVFERVERGVHHRPWYEAALWARRNTPQDAVFAMTDCGLFSYFSRRRTVNLDGVINSYEYQEALAHDGLPKFLSRCGVTHIADYEVSVDQRYRHRIVLPARLANKPGYEILVSQDSEVYASAPFRQRRLTARDKSLIEFVIWTYHRLSLHRR